MGKILKLGFILLLITAVTGVILGGVYTLTLEPIRMTRERQKLEAFAATLPGAKDFKTLELNGDAGLVQEVNEGSAEGAVIGHNVTVAPKGYSGQIEMIVGVTSGGELKGIKILNHTETPGLGAKAAEPAFAGQFTDKAVPEVKVVKTPPQSDEEIEAISGATITSDAVATGVNAALKYCAENF